MADDELTPKDAIGRMEMARYALVTAVPVFIDRVAEFNDISDLLRIRDQCQEMVRYASTIRILATRRIAELTPPSPSGPIHRQEASWSSD